MNFDDSSFNHRTLGSYCNLHVFKFKILEAFSFSIN
jgi:hypothetical protein